MSPRTDELRPLNRAIRLVGVAAVLILLAGLADYLYFEPPGQRSGHMARVVGVYQYDAKAHRVVDGPSASFPRARPFAAVVDWSSLPATLVVVARWYDSFDGLAGGVGPAPVSKLALEKAVPVHEPAGSPVTIPGRYIFVVERYADGRPVEVLGRVIVRVRR